MLNLMKYRDPWLAEKFDDAIGFFPREFYCFDNFSSFKVKYLGYVYSSVEEAYQAAKFLKTAPLVVEEIRSSYSADEAKRIAVRNKHLQREDWHEVKLDIMTDLIRLKVEQNSYVRKKLRETKDYLIVEDSPYDDFWGWGKTREGENHLGKIWMQVREELIEKDVQGSDISRLWQNKLI